jgi:hypothetical protein
MHKEVGGRPSQATPLPTLIFYEEFQVEQYVSDPEDGELYQRAKPKETLVEGSKPY